MEPETIEVSMIVNSTERHNLSGEGRAQESSRTVLEGKVSHSSVELLLTFRHQKLALSEKTAIAFRIKFPEATRVPSGEFQQQIKFQTSVDQSICRLYSRVRTQCSVPPTFRYQFFHKYSVKGTGLCFEGQD